LLLELAEIIDSMRCHASTIILCTKRLKMRCGRHWVNGLRASGHNIFPASQIRVLSVWAFAQRAFQMAEDVVLVTDWNELSTCFNIFQQASQSNGIDFHVSGVVVLCDRGQERQAENAIMGALVPCQWRLLPSLAF